MNLLITRIIQRYTVSKTSKLAATCSAAKSRAHLLYKLYSLQLNCTYSKYREAVATCSAAQQNSTFIVQTVQSETDLYLQ